MKHNSIFIFFAYITLVVTSYTIGRFLSPTEERPQSISSSLTKINRTSGERRDSWKREHLVWSGTNFVGLDQVSQLERFRDAITDLGISEEELISNIFEADWETALDIVGKIKDTNQQIRLLGELLRNSPARLFPQLQQWIMEQNEKVIDGVRRELVQRWLIEDEDGLIATIDGKFDKENAMTWRNAVFEFLPVSDQLAQIDDFVDQRGIKMLVNQMERFASFAPEQTLEELMRRDPISERGEAIQSLFKHWAESDPVRAAQAAADLTDPEVAADALYQVAFQWSNADSYRTTQWIESMTEGPNRDAATAGFVAELSTAQPDMAFVWAREIINPKVRKEALEVSYRNWMQLDSVAAKLALEQSNLPEAVRVQLQER